MSDRQPQLSDRRHYSPAGRRPVVGLACSESIRQEYIDPRCSPPRNGSRATVPGVRGRRWPGRAAVRDPQTEAEFASFVSDLDALVVCHGSPFVSDEVLDAGPGSACSASSRATGSVTTSTRRSGGERSVDRRHHTRFVVAHGRMGTGAGAHRPAKCGRIVSQDDRP